MISRRLITVIAAALLAACGRGAGQEGAGETSVIRFAVLSPEPGSALATDWAPIIKDMEASTSLEVKAAFANSDATVVDAMRQRRLDLGWFSNQAGLEAVRRAGGEVFARTTGPGGVEGYYSVLIVAAKSKLTLDRVLKCDRTLRLGMGEALSTAGALAPETYLFAPRGVRPIDCFKQVKRGSPHANLLAVAAGQLDVATDSTTSLQLDRKSGRWEAGEVREIWRSPVLPEYPIIWRRDLDPAIKEKLRQFFLTYGQGTASDAATQRVNLARIGIGGFEPADDAHLLPVREMEATQVWLEAKASGDKARIEAARRALDAITAQRQALEARTRAPAAAQ